MYHFCGATGERVVSVFHHESVALDQVGPRFRHGAPITTTVA